MIDVIDPLLFNHTFFKYLDSKIRKENCLNHGMSVNPLWLVFSLSNVD